MSTTRPASLNRGRAFLRLETMTDQSAVVRVDYADQPIRMERTPEGYLTGEARVARIGVQAYQDGAGGIRREYRPTAEVFSADAIASFRNVPVTMGHPQERLVTSDNARRLSVGFVGENLRVDGEWLVMPITITDADTVREIEGGTVQLSGGYAATVVDQAGEYSGEVYDAVQTNIRGNHVAIVQQARAGADARLNLDAADAVAINQQPEVKTDMADKTVTVRVDGIEYEAAPEVERHISKQAERIDSLNGDLESAKSEAETAKAKADAAAEELETYKAEHNDEAIREAARQRVSLERSAVKVLGDEADLGDKSDREIQEAVVKAVHKDADMADASDVYVKARFDAAIDIHKAHADASDKQRETAAPRQTESKSDASDKKNNMMSDIRDAYKRKDTGMYKNRANG